MVKEEAKPSRSMSRRRIRSQAEWKVEAQISSAPGPSRAARRSFSSPAALLVKVMAMMDQGTAGSRRHSRSCRSLSPCPVAAYPSKKVRSSPVTHWGTSGLSEPRPYFIRLAMRWMSTVVLPLPAPASRSSGPSVASTARCCSGFSRANSRAMAARRALQNRSSCSWSSMVSLIPSSSVVSSHCTRKGACGQPRLPQGRHMVSPMRPRFSSTSTTQTVTTSPTASSAEGCFTRRGRRLM